MALSNVKAILDIEDEIALEGLDGITLQGLWLRLENRPDFSKGVALDENTKRCIWLMISDNAELRFYKLPSPRPDLVIYNRYEHMDPELGIVVESPKNSQQDIYPFHKVEDEATGEMGSCLHYYTRKDVSEDVAKLSLDEVQKRYKPGQLVVVASQMLREKALWVSSNVDPFNPLTLAQYCILERIARTRTMGDITQGKHGMTQLGDAKSLFYHRKRLLKLRLITKQTHLQKNVKGVSQTGSLLHHIRFYVERKTKFVLLIEHCVDLVRAAPNYTLPLSALKESIALPDLSFKKLTKNTEFSKYIKSVSVPYSELHPDASHREIYNKNNKERTVACAQLVDPSLNLNDVLAGKDDAAEGDDEEDEETAGILDRSKIVLFKSTMQQSYEVARDSGPKGTTQRAIMEKLGQSRLDSRSICRGLLRSGAVESLLHDVGRQRITHYVVRDQIEASPFTQQFTQEKQKLMKLLQKTASAECVESSSSPNDLSEASSSVACPSSNGVVENEIFSSSPSKDAQSKSKSKKIKHSPDEGTSQENSASASEVNVILPIQLDSSARVIALADDNDHKSATPTKRRDEEDQSTADDHVDVGSKHVVSGLSDCETPVKSLILASPSQIQSTPARSIERDILSSLEEAETRNDSMIITSDPNPALLETVQQADTPENCSALEGEIDRKATSALKLKSEEVNSLIQTKQEPSSPIRISNVGRIFDKSKGEYVSDGNLQEAMLSVLNETDGVDVSLQYDEPVEEGADAEGESASDDDLPRVSSIIEDSSLAALEHPDVRYKKFLDGSNFVSAKSKRISPRLTARLLKRSNVILELVRTKRVVNDIFQLQKTILESEADEEHRVDKKSVNRLVQRLRAGGLIKTVRVKFTTKSGSKENVLVVDPSVKPDDPYLTFMIEQLKAKHVPTNAKKDAHKKQAADDTASAKSDGSQCLMASTTSGKSLGGKKHGSAKKIPLAQPGPKFVVLQELHHLLFYCVRHYEGDAQLDQEASWSAICQDYPDAKLLPEPLPRLYIADVSWKMFIPPMPEHVRETPGWILLSDLITSIPLHVFTRIVRCSHTPELLEWLNHPIKRFYLVRMLPASLRSSLFEGRRFVSTIIQLVHRLCYMGLAQMGPQLCTSYKEREQQFVYLNTMTTLMDTSSSGPGYHQISQDRSYSFSYYTFKDLRGVSQYWQDLRMTCLSTPLGGHKGLAGQDITIHMLSHKPQMEAAIAVTQFNEAPQRDTGEVPGDKKGAAGLDSAMFTHIKRNWNFRRFARAASEAAEHCDAQASLCEETPLQTNTSTPSTISSQIPGGVLYRSYLLSTTQAPHASSSSRLPGLRKVAAYKNRKGEEKCVEVGLQIMSREEKKLQKPKPASEQKKKEEPVVRKPRRSKVMLRRIKARRRAPKKPYYDEEDRAALRRMNKLRVDWSSAEDSLLLLCKVASCYLLPVSIRPRMLPFSLVRSVLHKHCPESLNKTGRACQRRINYILKDPTTEDSVAIYVEEVKQNQYIKKNFAPPGITRSRENLESIYGTLFVRLVDYLVVKFGSKSSRKVLDLPNSIMEFHRAFMVVPMKGIKPAPHYHEPESITDIEMHAIRSLLMSSLCCRADRESYAYQLYQAYGHYSHQTLYNTLVNLRNSQMISYKKLYNRPYSNNQTCLPLSASPFQLSLAFTHKFINRYNYDLFNHCWKFMKRLRESYHKAYVSGKQPDELVQDSDYAVPLTREKKNEGGSVAALIELTSIKRLIMHTCLPETIIVVDTKRTITNQLPYQVGSVSRRVADLAKARSKPGEFDDSLGLQDDHFKNEDATCIRGVKRSRNDSGCAKENDEHNKRKLLVSEPESNKPDDGPIPDIETEEDAVRDVDTELNGTFQSNQQPDFDDNFDFNDDSVDELNSSIECNADDTMNTSTLRKSDLLKTGGQKRAMNFEPPEQCKKRRLDEEGGVAVGQEEPLFGAINPNKEISTLSDENSATDDGQAVPIDAMAAVSKRWPVTSASRLSVFIKDRNTISSLEKQALACGGPALLQHMQDNLLLTACDVMCLLTPSFGSSSDAPSSEDNAAVWKYIDSDVLPVDRQNHKRVLLKCSKGVVDTSVTLSDVLAEWEQGGCSEVILALVRQIYKFIHARGAYGATRQHIKEWRARCGEGDCMAVVVAMEEAGLLVREGVVEATWLTLPNASHWLIHTRYISRQDRQGVRLQGVYSVEVESSLLKETVNEGSVIRVSESMNSDCQTSQPSNLASDEIPDTPEVENSSSVETITADLPAECTADVSEDCSTSNSCLKESCVATTAEDNELTSGQESEHAEELKTDATSRPGMCTRKRYNSSKGGAKTELAADDTSSKHENTLSDVPTSPEKDATTRARVRSRFVAAKKNYTKDEEISQRMEEKVKDCQKSDSREQVLVSVRPWLRVCGTLARRVLDRMLGTVMFVVLEKPGISGANVAQCLTPSMPPAHVHELLHLLIEIGCVRRTCVVSQEHCSLFSRPSPLELKDHAEEEVEETDVSYLPTVDCITRLSTFIGDKKYSMDFISSDRK